MLLNGMNSLMFRGACPRSNVQVYEEEGRLSEKEEGNKPHVCSARKKPVVVGVRIEKSAGGGIGRKYTTYRLPDGRLETVSEAVPIVEDTKKNKIDVNIHEKKIERGEHRLDYMA